MTDYKWYQDVFISRIMLWKDCHKPYWKERFIDGLPPIFAHKVKQVLMGKNDSIDYDNLTYDDIFSAIKKFGTNMCNNEKLLTYQLQIKKKAKYKMGNFCEQYGLPPIAPSREKDDLYTKKKNISETYDKQPSKLKNKFNILNIDDKDQEELFKILESNNSSNSLKDDFSSSSNSCYQSADDSSDSPNIKIGCRDSCCNVINSVNTLTKDEENEKLIIQLIN